MKSKPEYENKSQTRQFKIWISRINTFSLVFSPFIVGLFCAVLGMSGTFDSVRFLSEEVRDILIFACMFIFWSTVGFVFIIKREIPPMFIVYIHGTPAIIIGIIWMIFFLYIAIFPIWRYLSAQ